MEFKDFLVVLVVVEEDMVAIMAMLRHQEPNQHKMHLLSGKQDLINTEIVVEHLLTPIQVMLVVVVVLAASEIVTLQLPMVEQDNHFRDLSHQFLPLLPYLPDGKLP